jgi:nucleoside-diphosphate-sugar epimerase
MRLPTFFVIGAAKAGTTALYNFLAQHPDIYMSPIKETNFFCFEGATLDYKGPGVTVNSLITSYDAYCELFSSATTQTALGEVSPMYMAKPIAAQRIHSRLPEVRLIAILRHPVDRAYSSFLHLRRDGREPIADFEQALREEPQRTVDNWEFLWRYRALSRYAPALASYYDVFPSAQIRVFKYDDFRSSPEKVLSDVFGHIRVDPDFRPRLADNYNVSRAEPAPFDIEHELRQIWPQLDLKARIGDVGDQPRMRSLLARYRPHVVFHAAAHKHVPLMEENATEAVKNNIVATALLGDVVAEFGVEAFVLISTDKAVKPTSLMGASKRVAELLIQDLDRRHADTRFLAVRFGNVLGSTGSVVPLFRRQIKQGGPVTVTHQDASRYFMTIPEAAQLVLEASAIGPGGAILLLDMGKPIKIPDLAEEMIRLSGFQPFDEIPIVFTGLRPGEKIFEELELSSEKIDRTIHPKIFVGKLGSCPPDELQRQLRAPGEAAESGREDVIRTIMSELVDEASLERHHPDAAGHIAPRPRNVIN